MIIKPIRHESKKLRASARGRDCQITHERIKQLFDYDPETGLLLWKNIEVKNQVKIGRKAGYITDCGYLRITIDGAQYYLHRIIWMFVYGVTPDGFIDHINHDRTDNRISNMRSVTRIENNKNKSKSKNNTSDVTGIIWIKARNKWRARITVNKKLLDLGSFDHFYDACIARKNAEIKYKFHKNHGV